MANLEVRTDVLSESTNGRPIHINEDYTTVTDVTHIHTITQANVLDSVYLEVFNSYSSNINVKLILSPANTSNSTNVDDATVEVTVPRYGSAWLLQGQRFRRTSGTAYTIAAYVDTAYVGYLHVTGWYSRIYQPPVTA